jgi:DNA repair protein RadC
MALQDGPGLFSAPAASSNQGHRERLKARFREAGAQALADYELLEMALFFAIPRRDVKPLAKRLLAEFGDFNRAVSASPERLRKVEGVGPAVVDQLKLLEAAAHRLARAKVLKRPHIGSYSALVEYCRTAMAHAEVEEFRILFLDRRNVLIRDEAQGRGTVGHVSVYPREVVKRGLELAASGVILVHNHPSGDPTPSEADIDMTRRIKTALDAVEIALHEHVVIGKSRESSFVSLGLI